MRITLVTETYLPQVNGVSRTLEQLVRVLRAAGDEVQLVAPDYERQREAPPSVAVASCHPPFYPELYLPLPPFGRVLSSIREFGPDLVHIATEATLGWRCCEERAGGMEAGLELSYQFRPVRRALPNRAAGGAYLAVSPVVSQSDPGDLRTVEDDDRLAGVAGV